MSRIGQSKITIPDGVTVSERNGQVMVKGPKGEMKAVIPARLAVQIQEAQCTVTRSSDENTTRALHGTFRKHIHNMVQGVHTGFQKVLELNGIGYRVQKQGKSLNFTLGYSHPIKFMLVDAVDATVEKQTVVTVKGIDRALVGQVAANIRSLRPPERYKGKGIKYADEIIKKKEGKSGKASAG